jgi:hypothetical protein
LEQSRNFKSNPEYKIKQCTKCKQHYPATSKFFYKHRRRYDGFDPWCKHCKRTYDESYHLLKMYNLSTSEVKKMLEKQDNKCAICGIDFEHLKEIKENKVPQLGKPRIDHNHHTGEIRGLLCDDCNLVLGKCKENPLILIKAAFYLKLHN